MELPDDDRLNRVITELGLPEEAFRVSRERFLAKLGLGLLLILYGVAANYYWWVHGPATFGQLELLMLIVLPLSGVVLIVHLYRERGQYVLVYPTGLLRLRRGEVDSFAWEEVDHILVRCRHSPLVTILRDDSGTPVACWIAVEVPVFQLWAGGLTIVRRDGRAARLGPVLGEYNRLAEEVQRRTFAALWPAVWKRFVAGETLSFSDIDVNLRGVRSAQRFLSWQSLNEVAISAGHLSFKEAGRWLPWQAVEVGSVPNPHVLFALITEGRTWVASMEQPQTRAEG